MRELRDGVRQQERIAEGVRVGGNVAGWDEVGPMVAAVAVVTMRSMAGVSS